MKKVLNILIPLFILLGILDLLVYNSNKEEEEVYQTTIDEYQEVEDSVSIDNYITHVDDSMIPKEEKFTLRIEKFCYMTESNMTLIDEFGEIFQPKEIIPYLNQGKTEYAFLQFEDLSKGFYYLSMDGFTHFNRYSTAIELKESLVLSYKELINSFYSKTTDSLITDNKDGLIPLVISVHNIGENCRQNTFIISKQNDFYEVIFNSPSSNFTREYKVKNTFWKEVIQLENELVEKNTKNIIEGKVDFSIVGMKTYSNTNNFEVELFNAIERHEY